MEDPSKEIMNQNEMGEKGHTDSTSHPAVSKYIAKSLINTDM